MAQVVETDTLHLVCYQKIREMLAQEIGPNPLSHRVYMEKSKSGRTILVTTHDRELIESCCDNIVEVEKRSS